jgi:hypothetical protein
VPKGRPWWMLGGDSCGAVVLVNCLSEAPACTPAHIKPSYLEGGKEKPVYIVIG